MHLSRLPSKSVDEKRAVVKRFRLVLRERRPNRTTSRNLIGSSQKEGTERGLRWEHEELRTVALGIGKGKFVMAFNL